MKLLKSFFVRLILVLILPLPLSLPTMAYYDQTFDNGVDQFKYTLSGTMVVKGQLYRSDASTFETIKKEYKGKANLPDYNVPIKKMEISGIEFKTLIIAFTLKLTTSLGVRTKNILSQFMFHFGIMIQECLDVRCLMTFLKARIKSLSNPSTFQKMLMRHK